MRDFTRKYSLSKTLRFELKPVGETAEHIEDFKSEALQAIVAQDKQRAQDYKEIKKIIDGYHQDFIEKVLSQKILTNDDIKEAFECYKSFKSSKDNKTVKDNYQKIQKKLRKKIADEFSKQAKLPEYALFDAKLINEKSSGEKLTKGCLWNWLKDRLDNSTITQEEFDKSEKVIKNFDKFYTYFTGFNQNRQNIYSAEEQSTAISYRIVHDNMIKHFNNCLNFANIEKNHKDFYKNIKNYKEIFIPTAFTSFLAQSGIDVYSEKIGHKSDDINAKGVNQLINEYCQQNSTKDKKIKLPKMTVLYKQILSDKENKFKIDVFEDDKQLLDTINDFYKAILPDLKSLKVCLNEYLNGNSADDIYIRNDISLTNISQQIWNDWSLIGAALEKYADEELKLNKSKKEKLLKEDVFSITQIQTAVEYYLKDFEDKTLCDTNIVNYLKSFESKDGQLLQLIEDSYNQAEQVLLGESLEKNKENKIEKIRVLLDSIMNVLHFVKPLSLFKSGKALEVSPKKTAFYDTFDSLYKKLSEIIGIYNKTRNYVTKKPYKMDKFKINFENSTLLDGWDVNKETDNTSVLFLRNGKYYLGIMAKKSNSIFNYRINPDDSNKKQKEKQQLRQQIITAEESDSYEKVVYKLLPDPAKMLPKVFFSARNIDYYQPSSEIIEIREKGLFKKEANDRASLRKWIDFMKQSLSKHPEWGQYFSFDLKSSSDYQDSSQFYKQVAGQGYKLSFDRIKKSYIDEKVKAGELCLFEIYSKDFSKFSKGRPNLHTSYWKLLFSKENLDNVVVKLNGQAEIFFRPASLKKSNTAIHKAKKPIDNKNPLNPRKQSTFDYDIIKDRRFTRDKFFFHCPITLNFKASSIAGKFNDGVSEYLKGNPDVNIIGIDRGERHLLYYSVINKEGKIIEDGSLNTVTNSYKSNGRPVDVKTNYHQLLDNKEVQRDKARKSWSTIENIKELKSGYLSHIVHKVAQLMIKHNAIVVLEDLNFGFKRGRFKVEKQVYQKFEKALIDKLNYLVFKDKEFGQAGHYLNAYQLTAPFESFQKLGKQSGFLFYVTSDYTSKIDPVTGFVNRLNTSYKSVEKSREFFRKFNSICFNKTERYFEFAFDYKKFPKETNKKTKWTVCTAGKQRYRYNRQKKDSVCYDVTSELKELFEKYSINYKTGENLINSIITVNDAAFFKSLLFFLGLTLQLRHSDKDGDVEKDFILSPVKDEKTGKFFDSSEYESMENPSLPANADANGAYNIARKGLMVLEQINSGKKPSPIKNVEWFDFAQKS